jgi:nucleotide-binding universal stress UspA family protein
MLMTIPIPAPVREVLFATDFSPSSEVAGSVAAGYAWALGARLHVLHVVQPPRMAKDVPGLTDLAARLGKSCPAVAVVASGTPAVEIVRYAARQGIDLIVVGTHGRTGVTRALLGSVAEKVSRTASCPVLTVPPGARRAAGTRGHAEVIGTEDTGIERCLVCAARSEELICDACRARIRGEAVDRKLDEMRAGVRR